MKAMKKFVLFTIFLLAFTAAIFYRFGRQDQLNDLRQQYPHFYNIKKKKEGNCCPYEHDDIWITDSARVHIWQDGQGWVKLN